MVLDPQNDYPTISETMFSSETVTLTKAQLKAILEAVGQVGGLRLTDDTVKPQSQTVGSIEPEYRSVHEELPTAQPKSNISLDENLNGFPSVDAGMSSSLLSSSQSPSVSSNSCSPISKLQQKRLQWEKERAETEYWSPWGRPGAGAPRSNKRSVVMATVSPSTSGESLKNQSRGYSGCSYLTSASLPSSTAYGQRVPDFLKSSLPFGPNSDEPDNEHLDRKRQWLSELEQQREEQKRRLGQSGDPFDGDRWGFEEEADDNQQLSSPVGPHSGMNTPLSTVTNRSRSYHRGQNSLDPDKAMQLQEQRERALEYRRSIEEQVEEKRRKQQEEREKIRREEEAEELRLEQERERIRLQYELEQQQIKDKEEQEEQKRQVMVAAVQKAREEAEAEKKAKKAQRLNSQAAKSPMATPTHQVPISSRLSVREENTHNSTDHLAPSRNSSANTSPKHLEKTHKDQPQQTARVLPVQSSPSAPTKAHETTDFTDPQLNDPRSTTISEMSSQTDQPVKLPPEPSAYVANRLLTPSVWRTRERRVATQNAWGHHRDMSTQTEQLYWVDDIRLQDQPSYSADDRSSRNSSANSGKRSCADKGGYKSDSGTRPVWGANQPIKSFVKMTDRDPNHYRRKKLQEMRRQHWEREMASLREQLAQAGSRSRSTGSQSVAEGSGPVGKSVTSKSKGMGPRLSRSRVAAESAFPVRRRAASDSQSGKLSERDSAWSSAGSSVYTMSANSLGTTYTISSGHLPTLSRRWSHSSDHIPPLSRTPDGAIPSNMENFDSSLLVPGEQESSFFPPVRRKWHSHESFADAMQRQQPQQSQELRPRSPPTALDDGKRISKSMEEPSLLPPPPPPPAPRRKWSEQGNFDPAAVALGRNLGVDSDSEKGSPDHTNKKLLEPDPSQDPLVNPKVVTSRPTPRQDRILQQLSTLRQGLLQKQREIEILLRQPSSWPS